MTTLAKATRVVQRQQNAIVERFFKGLTRMLSALKAKQHANPIFSTIPRPIKPCLLLHVASLLLLLHIVIKLIFCVRHIHVVATLEITGQPKTKQ